MLYFLIMFRRTSKTINITTIFDGIIIIIIIIIIIYVYILLFLAT